MKVEITQGELVFLEKIRRTKEEVRNEFTTEDKMDYLNHKVEEITRYVIYEVLR